MPALVNNRFGALGSKLAEGTMVCPFSRKKSKNDCLISDAFMVSGLVPSREDPRKTVAAQARAAPTLDAERSNVNSGLPDFLC
jgi:hypothetical protein